MAMVECACCTLLAAMPSCSPACQLLFWEYYCYSLFSILFLLGLHFVVFHDGLLIQKMNNDLLHLVCYQIASNNEIQFAIVVIII